MSSMFDLLMELPLFRGVSAETMHNTVGQAKFHFLKYPQGETIIEENRPCTHITFLVSGSVRLTTANRNGRISVSQTLKAPDVIAPEFLFGRATNYPCTVVALEDTGIMQVSKGDYIKILNSDPVFMFNYLNIISMNAQKSVTGLMSLTSGSLEERIAFWVLMLTQHTGENIAIDCPLRNLCAIWGVQRSALVEALTRMQGKCVESFGPTGIVFSSRRNLLDMLSAHPEIATDSEENAV
ncbi:MAG: Crp/Fnr family transcriptional regulator [Muribaculaceae bacterium]|nr:Crp/Fnr family transcriptional regulator [Muribaculaceae bacterium]